MGEAGEGPKLPDQSEESINYIDQSEQSIYLARMELLELASLRLTRTVLHLCPVILVSGLVWKLGRCLSYFSSARGMSIMLPDVSLSIQHLSNLQKRKFDRQVRMEAVLIKKTLSKLMWIKN